MSKERAYTVVVTQTREVEVFAECWEDANRYAWDMVENGDACAEHGPTTFANGKVRDLTEEES